MFILVNVNGKMVRIVLHNQWLYGCIALELLILLLATIEEHVSKEDPTMCIEGTEEALLSKAEEKHCSEYNCIGWDPMLGDNNNGITVIDARDASHPKYCFMAIHSYTECLDFCPEDVRRVLIKKRYGEYQPARGYPLSASDYIDLHYPPREEEPKFKFIAQLKAALAKYTVLTPAECFEQFPTVYEKINVEEYEKFYKVIVRFAARLIVITAVTLFHCSCTTTRARWPGSVASTSSPSSLAPASCPGPRPRRGEKVPPLQRSARRVVPCWRFSATRWVCFVM